MDLHLDRPGGRVRDSVMDAIRDAIRTGRLVPGTRLPSSRALAADLGVARNTVARAYAELIAEGWLTAQHGSSTLVSQRAAEVVRSVAAPANRPSSRRLDHDLRPGHPDLSSFPRIEWSRAGTRALKAAPFEAFGYADPPGRPELRLALAQYLARARGVRAQPCNIIVCTGAAEGLRDRTPTIPGHEVAGVVAELGYGTTGLTVGQRVFGVTDWCRNGTLAEFVAVEARNLAPLSDRVDPITAAALPISGLTAWQGLFTHGQLHAGQTILIHGAAGGVGSVAVQLAHEAGARVIGTGRTAHRQTVLDLGAEAFVDLELDQLESVGEVDVVFDVMGGEILERSATLVRSGGALVSIAEPPPIQPEDRRAVFFVVEPDRGRKSVFLRSRRHRRRRLHFPWLPASIRRRCSTTASVRTCGE
jgi:NADPH:quinone reductase-like Zn-dependent oxidoreductase